MKDLRDLAQTVFEEAAGEQTPGDLELINAAQSIVTLIKSGSCCKRVLYHQAFKYLRLINPACTEYDAEDFLCQLISRHLFELAGHRVVSGEIDEFTTDVALLAMAIRHKDRGEKYILEKAIEILFFNYGHDYTIDDTQKIVRYLKYLVRKE